MRYLALLLVSLGSGQAIAAGRTRRVDAVGDAPIVVTTSLGHSTMLEFDGEPSPVVVGDQDAFRVEYAGQRLAVKPLLGGARTNLFVSTAFDDFVIDLIAVDGAKGADYKVRIQRRTRGGNVGDAVIGTKGTSGPVVLEVEPGTRSSTSGRLYVPFRIQTLQSGRGRTLSLGPSRIKVARGGSPLVVESLFLERTEADPKHRTIEGAILAIDAGTGQAGTVALTIDYHIGVKRDRVRAEVPGL